MSAEFFGSEWRGRVTADTIKKVASLCPPGREEDESIADQLTGVVDEFVASLHRPHKTRVYRNGPKFVIATIMPKAFRTDPDSKDLIPASRRDYNDMVVEGTGGFRDDGTRFNHRFVDSFRELIKEGYQPIGSLYFNADPVLRK